MHASQARPALWHLHAGTRAEYTRTASTHPSAALLGTARWDAKWGGSKEGETGNRLFPTAAGQGTASYLACQALPSPAPKPMEEKWGRQQVWEAGKPVLAVEEQGHPSRAFPQSCPELSDSL